MKQSGQNDHFSLRKYGALCSMKGANLVTENEAEVPQLRRSLRSISSSDHIGALLM